MPPRMPPPPGNVIIRTKAVSRICVSSKKIFYVDFCSIHDIKDLLVIENCPIHVVFTAKIMTTEGFFLSSRETRQQVPLKAEQNLQTLKKTRKPHKNKIKTRRMNKKKHGYHQRLRKRNRHRNRKIHSPTKAKTKSVASNHIKKSLRGKIYGQKSFC